MHDSAAPDEQPPYMNECREMSFANLRGHIHDAVESLSNPSFSSKITPLEQSAVTRL